MSDEVVEIPLTDLDAAETLYGSEVWPNSIDPAYNLHIRIANTQRILLLVKANHKWDGQTASLNFANQAG
jgi:hypothetical protein